MNNCIHKEVCRFSKRIKSGACSTFDGYYGCAFYVPADELTPYIHADTFDLWLKTLGFSDALEAWREGAGNINGTSLEDIIAETYGNGTNDDDDDDAIGYHDMNDWGI